MLHLQSPHQRSIGLNDNAVFLAKRGYLRPGIEGVDLYLVNDR
jgi:hypothetical protein